MIKFYGPMPYGQPQKRVTVFVRNILSILHRCLCPNKEIPLTFVLTAYVPEANRRTDLNAIVQLGLLIDSRTSH